MALNGEVNQQVAEMKHILAQVLSLVRETRVSIPMRQEEHVVPESAMTKLPYDTTVKPMRVSTKDVGVDSKF